MNKTIRSILVAAALTVATFTGNAQTISYFGTLTGSPISGTPTNSVCAALATNTYYANYTVTNTVYTNGVISGTNIVTQVASTNFVTVLSSRWVSIQPMYNLLNGQSSGASNVVFRLDASTDNIDWNIGVTNLVVAASNGTNLNTQIFTIDTGGTIYWRVGQVQNTNAAIATNIVVTIGKRPGL